MEDGDTNADFKMNFTFALVLRGEMNDINNLLEFLKRSNLRIAHKQLSQNKLWIKEGKDEY